MSEKAQERPKALIIGAGLSGMLLAILFERQGISYKIFEKTLDMKPLGSCMAFNANILPVLDQLGLLEETKKISLQGDRFDSYSSDLKFLGSIRFGHCNENIGYPTLMFTRYEMHNLLKSKIPKERFVLGKKMTSYSQDDDGVEVFFEDDSSYKGEILIGADGAYSSVRKSMYKQIEPLGLLPKKDIKDMKAAYITMVGVSKPLDPEKYPILKSPISTTDQMMGGSSGYSWTTVTVTDNRVSWGVVLQLETTDIQEARATCEWGEEGIRSMTNDVKDFKTTFGATLGEFIEQTPIETISKVFLEEKMFETWYHNRVVLIGDACHKFLPSVGQGAMNAMQDSVVLANTLFDIEDYTTKNIVAAFKDYRQQRYNYAQYEIGKSTLMGRLSYGQGWIDRILRHIVFNFVPQFIFTRQVLSDTAYRPQATFLPRAPKRGTVSIAPQKPSKRYLGPNEIETSRSKRFRSKKEMPVAL
ncbi:hypothetical protein BGW38_010839 [Lunasporangiospora selenospora]|uniref:FAD-binding domain-containing protein n=1 Tax=Lunasporangiospora selenospora TaxID=979761 RepID=A0A9P6FXW0_9FUNG|nr:hypothetical protein BGW38_010839 [Lunasporangiospora selenospora]